ncbi:LysR family transcriptional regulator [Leeia sp. TBRC 13508]|uniref:LysR family transcriptional regulator n=1 Tax=Leeia speluncae TaxID=2884804 RepID=A0ABS8D7Z3_9NEIS|nr:LysR family transcriptional regulator [Leeia speluncae]MCB6184242.1 LysR family transcriptional regulator [Leeia speluncae]
MDPFVQIASFVGVASKGSLSAVARDEGVTPSIIGRRLDALEARLGIKLLIRTTRKTTLTREGSAFLEDCQRILLDLSNAEAAVTLGGVKARGHLRVSAPAGFGRRFIAPLVHAFSSQHAEVSISLELTDRLVDLVNEGIDCSIRIGGLPDSNLVSVKLAENRRVVVASHAYLEREGVPETPAQLAQHQCLLLSGSSQHRGWMFQQEGDVQTVKVGGVLECNDGAVLHEWALAGLGLAWRSWWEVGKDIESGRLHTVLDAYAAPPTGVYILFPQRQLPLRVRLFVDFLKAHFAGEQDWMQQ